MAFDAQDYDPIRAGMVRSAATVVPEIVRLVEPASVVDVGCGQGVWLAEFARQGCRVQGYDGHDGARLDISPDQYATVDLNTVQRLGFPVDADLAVCLEVAEHLSAQRAEWLVETLCQVDIVLFSAAVPRQGGQGHINEQWPDYWAQIFYRNHFAVSGALRWRWWNLVPENIEVWYAQNILLCVRDSALPSRPALSDLFDSEATGPHPIVHPYYWVNR
jgi:SAM-dependent methyltransferase